MNASSFVARLILCKLLAFAIAIPGAFAADNEKAAVLYEEALQQFEKGELSTAAIQLKNVLRDDPRFLAAHVLLARVYLKQFDGAQAEKELKIAQRLGADQALVLPLLAEAYGQQRNYRQILKDINPGNFSHELNARLLVIRGDAYRELGQLDQAIFSYREAARYDPASIDPLLGEATALMANGQLLTAGQLIDRALALDPGAPRAWYAKGSLAHARGRLQEALRHYSHVLELAPEDYTARVARAGVYMDLGNNAAAIRDLERLYDPEAYDPQVPYLLGIAHVRMGNVDTSRKYMNRANEILTALPPEVIKAHGETLLLSSLVEYSLGEWEKALDHLDDYVKRYPDNPGGRKLLGSILFDKGRYDSALLALEPALEQIPNDYKLLTMLGTIYLKKGQLIQAVDFLDKAVSVGGKATEARTQRGLARLGLGNEEAGIDELSEVFAQGEATRQAGIALVMEHLKRGENAAAVRIARILSERNPDKPELLNLLAGAEVAAGDIEGARRHYRQILEQGPDILVPAINLAKIERAQGQVDKARARLQALARQYPGNELVMVEQAHLEESEGHLEKAIDLVEKAVALKESAITSQLYLGELYLRAGAREKLVQLLPRLGRLFPRDLRAMALAGRIHLALGEVEKARLEFHDMFTVAGGNARALVEVARLSRAAGDLDWAAWSLVNALKIKPQWLAPRLALVEVYLQADKPAEAAEVVAYLLKHFPDEPASHRAAGDLALAQGNGAQGISEYQIALQKGGGEDVVLRLYRAYLAGGDIQRAVDFLRDQLAKRGAPEDSPVLAAALAEGQLRLGDADAARALYEQLLAAGLRNAGMLNNLAMIYFEQKDPRALRIAREAHELAPEQPRISDTLGWLLVRAGKAEEGLRHLRNANLRDTADRRIRYHIAVALAELGRTGEALRMLRGILADEGAFADREAAKALLKRISGQK